VIKNSSNRAYYKKDRLHRTGSKPLSTSCLGTGNIIITFFKFFAIDILGAMMFDALCAIAKGCED